ncbi:disease resistance protein RUN1-like [Nymphaea colorata]|nr:disease resistance protein RUN1-like [Nymphaea colorata]
MEPPFDDEGKRRDVNGRKGKAAEPSSFSSPPKTIDKPRYDVFLSFRGEDTRKGFTSHLYNALCQRGIFTFIDSEDLEKGERIEELFNYIEASKIFVAVLSKGYADSRWCLREITKMVECGRLIIPIFFDVEPWDVRKHSGPFEAAFQKHESSARVGEEDLRKWKDALEKIGYISGYTYSLQNDTNGNEAHLIQNIVEQISRTLNKNARPITEHLVGMDSHIGKMYRLLDLTAKEVKMIGIVGMGGVGKTTIATVVYNKLLSDFEDCSFISNVRENFKQHNGGVALQQKLIKDILKVKCPHVTDVERGKSLFEERLSSKKVLIILDDADDKEQLKALAGKRYWFGSGSRIIITSRNSRVLLEHGVIEEDIYRPELLNKKNSFKLFYSYAFRGVRPTESEYVELSKEVVKATGDLPLALTVFGSLLWGRNIKQWKELLQKLRLVQNTNIDERLRVSYDGLEENAKQIFLDISCFLIGKKKEYASYMWEDCGLYPETAIIELQERSLINVNKRDEFEMHDLLRDMGRGIVAQEGEPLHRSRLRTLGDLLKSLAYKDKPRMAEGIVALGYTKGIVTKRLGYTKGILNTPAVLSTQGFVGFSHLRLLHLYGFAFKGQSLCLPERLKWLRLKDCKFSISVLHRISKWLSGASNLNAISILELIHVDDVDRILMEITSSSRKAFDSLKVLHLESLEMTRTPDFSKMKMICLRKLTLKNCEMLKEVDGSIGSLKSLVHLEVCYCHTLQRLPDSICKLISLETLILIGCRRLSSVPEKLGDMKSLRKLWAEDTGVRAIPDSIGDLSNLRTLSLNGNYDLEKLPDSMRTLDSLEELYINHFAERLCYHFDHDTFNLMNLDSKLHIGYAERFEWLAGLPNSSFEKVKELTIKEPPSYSGRLTIQDHSIQELPPYLGRLTNLEALSIRCPKLRALPEWLGQLLKLNSFELESDSLEAMPVMAGRMFENLRSLELNCPALKHVPDWSACGCSMRTLNLSYTNIYSLPSSIRNLAQLQELHLKSCKNLESLPPLPSSLHVLDARYCNNLRTTSDLSNLMSLKTLKLGCCRLLQDFCGLESIAHNLESLELPGPCGGLSGFSQLSPAFMTRVFKEAAFSSLETFSATGLYGEAIPCRRSDHHHQRFWITFPKVGRGGKRPTWVWFQFLAWLREEQEGSLSISIMEEDGHAVYQGIRTCTIGSLYSSIRGEEIAEYSREGYYLRMQVSGPTSFLNEISRHLFNVYAIVRYT